MKLSRIDQIALNGATGEHYKYEEIVNKILFEVDYQSRENVRKILVKLLMENFPDA